MGKLSRLSYIGRTEGTWVLLNFIFFRLFAEVVGYDRASMGIKVVTGYSFDEWHNVDTTVEVDVAALDVPDTARDSVRPYEPSQPHVARALLKHLPIEPSKFSFIDFGCGKGRVLFVAAERAFKNVCGVEISPTLVEICRNNIRKARRFPESAGRIEVNCADALDYEPPPGDLVLFFYSPFNADLMAKVVQKLEILVSAQQREIHLVHFRPHFAEELDRSKIFTKVRENNLYPWYAIYTNVPENYSRARERFYTSS